MKALLCIFAENIVYSLLNKYSSDYYKFLHTKKRVGLLRIEKWFLWRTCKKQQQQQQQKNYIFSRVFSVRRRAFWIVLQVQMPLKLKRNTIGKIHKNRSHVLIRNFLY